jgi:hypothetical protein
MILALLDRLADRRITTALAGARCLRCGRRIRLARTGTWQVAVCPLRGPVHIHTRCPLRLTARGRVVRDTVAAVSITALAILAGIVLAAWWPALSAALRSGAGS